MTTGSSLRPSRTWERLSARPTQVLAMVWVMSLAVLAGLAPLISSDRPLLLEEEGGLTSPLLRGLDLGERIALIATVAALLSLVAGSLASRLGRGRGRRIGLTLAAAILLPGLLLSFDRPPRHETRRYRLELLGRRELAAIDGFLARDSGSAAARAGLAALESAPDLPLSVAEEALRRRTRMERGTGSETEAAADRRRNGELLAALEDAVFPPNRFSADQPSFTGLTTPGGPHALGTDAAGRDLLAILVQGARRALFVMVPAVALATLIGGFLGLLAGRFGGLVDAGMQRLLELALSLPALFILVVLTAWLPPELRSGSLPVSLFLGLLLWPQSARLVAAQVREICRSDFVAGARTIGLSESRILLRHVLPHALTPMLLAATSMAAVAILAETSLSFLGLGIEAAPGWGRTLRDARLQADLSQSWHLAAFPGLAIFLTVLAINTLADGLRDALETQQR